MIVKMQKYSFLVHHAEYAQFLDEIRKIGVVHIETKAAEPTPEMQEMMRNISEVTQTMKSLELRKASLKEAPAPIELKKDIELISQLKEYENEAEKALQACSNIEKEIRQTEPWGDFSVDTMCKLSQAGLEFRFLVCPIKKFQEEWIQQYPIAVVSDLRAYRYFVLLTETADKETDAITIPGVDEVAAPERSLSELKDSLEESRRKYDEEQRKIDAVAWYAEPLIKAYYHDMKAEFKMADVWHQTTAEAEGKVKLVEGWVPVPNADELDSYLDTKAIVALRREAEEGEKVPIQLKNNKFTKVFELIGDFYELPNHKELDLTPFFAPFYMLYFGIALGDAGYGLIVLLASSLAKMKLPKMKQALTLGQYLGLATIVWGCLNGSFFGLNMGNFGIPFLENMKEHFITTDQLFTLSLVLGAIQIMFGKFIKIVNITIAQGFRYAFSTIGWIILILGLGASYLLSSNDIITAALAKNINIAVALVAGVLIMILNDPKRNVFMNILMGIWDIYGTVTGLLGDMLSYVRLFALGISGGILASVFNMMASSMSPDIPVVGTIVMIIILLAGHGITLVMSGIGAFVHPIRLTFVEFYNNSGFVGGGRKYSPFADEPKIAVNSELKSNN